MSYGKSREPCNSFRAWRGQEPLCGNCAWTEKEHLKSTQSLYILTSENMKEIIIPVEKGKRVKIRKLFSADNNEWKWEVIPQEKIYFWWGTSGWEEKGSMFVRIFSYDSEKKAIRVAEELRDAYLKGEN